MSNQADQTIEIHRQLTLGALLGEGGMGRVVAGHAEDLGQDLAVKSLLPELLGKEAMVESFEREAAIMASIDHPGSLPIYGMTREGGGSLAYVMQKVEGHNLAEILAKSADKITSVPHRAHLLTILLKASETAGSAHAKGIIHRDIKPENILINNEESVFLVDWGLAMQTENRQVEGSGKPSGGDRIMGTPGYMSPEQAEGRGDHAGPPTDVFSLGVILYEILTGKRPFQGKEGVRAEMLAAVYNDPPHPRRTNLLLPRSICEVCLKALHKDPTRRYPDARALADDLRAHLEGRAVSATRATVPERIRYAARRGPLQALGIAAIIFTLTAIAGFLGVQRWIDHRLADKAMERLETLELEQNELRTEMESVKLRLKEPGLSAEQEERLNYKLSHSTSRWLLGEFEALRILNTVADLRFIKVDVEIQTKAKQRLHSLIDQSIKQGGRAFAKAIIETLLERQADGSSSLELNASEIAELEALSDTLVDSAVLFSN